MARDPVTEVDEGNIAHAHDWINRYGEDGAKAAFSVFYALVAHHDKRLADDAMAALEQVLARNGIR